MAPNRAALVSGTRLRVELLLEHPARCRIGHCLQSLVLRHERRVLLAYVFQPHILVAFALSDDAVVKADIRAPAMLLPHLESGRGFVDHVQTFRFPVRRDENVIVDVGVHGLGEPSIERDGRGPVAQPARAKIFKPVVRRLNGVEANHLVALPLRRAREVPRAGKVSVGVDQAMIGEGCRLPAHNSTKCSH